MDVDKFLFLFASLNNLSGLKNGKEKFSMRIDGMDTQDIRSYYFWTEEEKHIYIYIY